MKGKKRRIKGPDKNTDLGKLIDEFMKRERARKQNEDYYRPAYYGTSIQQKDIRGMK